jgi:putative mRNA 3-end processing factor
LEVSPAGLYCREGDFYIDPWRKVDRAIVTHGHSDHARWGMKSYLCARSSVPILTARLGAEISVQGIEFGEKLVMNGVTVSLHPAGHIPGSAQVRVEKNGLVWVATGDYKTEADGTAEPFELVPCHGLITETTFGLPIYRWRPQSEVFAEINEWWRGNQQAGRTSLLLGYSLGKAQRLLAGVDASIGPLVVHGAVATMNNACRAGGAALPPTILASEKPKGIPWSQCLVVAPPNAADSSWTRKMGRASTAFASGWMAVRGARRRQSLDRGFVLSDHVDWPSLVETVRACGAETVWTTHGYARQAARFFSEMGIDSRPLETQFGAEDSGEEGDGSVLSTD